jgi:PTS system galactitol-specific IIA component
MHVTKDVLREELVLLHYEADSAEDALRALAAVLYDDGAVKDTYFDAMMERERAYPTGLPTEGIKVALPHAGVEHVHYSALAVATLAHPVKFHEMGAPDNELDVEIILMLANADPDEQVQTLRRLVDMFDEPASLVALKEAATSAEVVRLLRDGYQGG